MSLMERMVRLRRFRIARELMLLYGLDVPAEIVVGKNLILQHRGMGTVFHPDVVIGDNVTIYHQVTLGRADAHVPREQSPMHAIIVSDHAILYPGCKILGGPGDTTVGEGSIVAANAVLTRSTGDWEIWAGIPAVKVADRAPI